MLDYRKNLGKLLFLDIETTSQKENFFDLKETTQKLFIKRFKKDIDSKIESKIQRQILLNGKSENKNVEDITNEVYKEMYNVKGSIFPEFGRILCISVGFLVKNPNEDFFQLRTMSFSDEDEKKLLSDFINHEKLSLMLNKVPGKWDKNLEDYWALVSYNGKVFDYPFVSKRIIINGFKLPEIFDFSHLKPWETSSYLIDLKEVWQFSVWDATVSMDTLSDVFNIPSSKDDIDGSEVKDIYYKEKDLNRIKIYCEKDVHCLSSLYLKMKSMPDEVRLFKQ